MAASRVTSFPLQFASASQVATLFLAFSANAQTQPQSQPQSKSQPAAQSSSQQTSAPSSAQPSSDPQMQTMDGAKQESLADAARKAKAQKSRPDSGKVMTEDDLHNLRGGGVSVVGSSSPGRNPYTPAYTTGAYSVRDQEEQVWRARARPLLDQMEQVDHAIKATKAEIAKYGAVGFDPSSHLMQNKIMIDDRNSRLKSLQDQRARLDQQMDALQEEGRKAGADSSWFR